MIENRIWLYCIIYMALKEDLGAEDLITDTIITTKAIGKDVLETLRH